MGCTWLLGITLFLACAGPGAPLEGDSSHPAGSPLAPSTPKRIVAAIQGNPLGGYQKLDSNNSQRGNQELGAMLHAGLTVVDPTGQLRPQLAEAVPSVENGQWTIL